VIHKFPFLSEEHQPLLKKWLEKEKHESLSKHHSYAACGNDQESLRAKHYAECYTYIMMMIDYHMELP
jgi:hypothetical protein